MKPKIAFNSHTLIGDELSLGSCLDLLKDGTHGSFQNSLFGYPLLSAKDIDGEINTPKDSRLISEDDYKAIYSSYELKAKDVLLTIVGTVGRVAVVPEEVPKIAFQRSVAILRPKNFLDSFYLSYLLQSPVFCKSLLSRVKMGAQGGVYLKDLASIPVKFPSLTEQQKIAAFFTALDEKIKIQKNALDVLRRQREQFLNEIFSRRIALGNKCGDKGSDWISVKLKDISEIKTGPFGSLLHAEDYVQKGTPIVTTEHFKKGSLPLIADGIPQVSVSDSKRLSSYRLETGDIVFSRVGSVDINAIVENCHSGWLFSGRVLRVRCNESVEPRFLHYALSTNVVKKDIIARAVGLTMASINTSILEETRVVIPVDRKEQEFIGKFMNVLDERIMINLDF